MTHVPAPNDPTPVGSQNSLKLASVVSRVDAMRVAAPAEGGVRVRWPGAVLVCAAFAFAGAGAVVLVKAGPWSRGEPPTAPRSAAVDVGAAQGRPAPRTEVRASGGDIRLTGYFSAKQVSRVTTTVVGRIRRVAVVAGSEVRQGDVLAELDPVSADSDIAALRSRLGAQKIQVASDRLEHARARSNVVRQNELVSKGFVSEQAVEQARLAQEQAAMKVAMSEAQQQELQHSLFASDLRRQQYSVVAPFAGKVVTVTGQVGEVVTPGGYEERFARSGLFTLVGKGSMRVETAVQESLFNQVRQSGCAIVSSTSQPGLVTEHTFAIDEISQSVDRQRGAITMFLVARPALRDYPALDSEAEVVFVPAADRRCEALRG